jgi:transglutaminase-like putative cysteine protease
MKLRIAHRTVYRYREAPQRMVQTLRLTPCSGSGQQLLHWQVTTGLPLTRELDAWGNTCHGLTLERPGRLLVIHARGEVVTTAQPERIDCAGVEPTLYLRSSPLAEADAAIQALARVDAGLEQGVLSRPDATMTRPLIRSGPVVSAASRLAAKGEPGLPAPSATAAAPWLALAERVCQALPYRPGVTHAGTTAAQALAAGAGVCQDHAQVFIAACRSLGWPARYVSGYFLSTAPSAGVPASAVAAHASHAWAEVCIAPAERRWLAVDVTHACLTDERHVRLAVGPDYAGCAPVRGVRLGGTGETLDVSVMVDVLSDRTHPA